MEFEITRKEDINSEDYLIEVRAPMVAKKIQPGRCVVLLIHLRGERIPMSVQKAEGGKIITFERVK